MKDPENTSPEKKEPGKAPQGPARLTEDLRKLLLENGFDRVGFADAESTPGANHFRTWLERGYAGNMDYLARNAERRRDVQRVLEGTRGVIVTAKSASEEYDFVSRFFAPQSGVPEDPVTGSSHCCLAPYWSRRLGRDELVGYQASQRGGTVRVRLQDGRVILGGQAVTVFDAELH